MTSEELVDMAEVARRLGVEYRTVMAWRSRAHVGFPEPAAHRGRHPLWRWEDVEAWSRRPRPRGRPTAR